MKLREGTSDARVVKEVMGGAYRKLALGFDVLKGERWLDLGANVGAFGVYCAERGATAVCYEPDTDAFALLKENVPGFICINAAVGSVRRSVTWFRSQSPTDHSRGTFLPSSKSVAVGSVQVVTLDLKERYSGIKMDVEGAEGELIDSWALPRADKLVLEYHSSRDTEVVNFVKRVAILRTKYKQVAYPPELDRIVVSGASRFERWIDAPNLKAGGRYVQWPMADRLIFCKGRKA